MDLFNRTVIGYHGCRTDASIDFARKLLDGTAEIDQWRSSVNDYDWLGHGIYFWEYAPERAVEWAGDDGLVIGAIIQLGRCFDLTNTRYTNELRSAYHRHLELCASKGIELPENHGQGLKNRKLDCSIINALTSGTDRIAGRSGREGMYYQTIRCPFEEGESVYPGTSIRMETHVQVAVRDHRCILGVFRPRLDFEI